MGGGVAPRHNDVDVDTVGRHLLGQVRAQDVDGALAHRVRHATFAAENGPGTAAGSPCGKPGRPTSSTEVRATALSQMRGGMRATCQRGRALPLTHIILEMMRIFPPQGAGSNRCRARMCSAASWHRYMVPNWHTSNVVCARAHASSLSQSATSPLSSDTAAFDTAMSMRPAWVELVHKGPLVASTSTHADTYTQHTYTHMHTTWRGSGAVAYGGTPSHTYRSGQRPSQTPPAAVPYLTRPL